VRRFGLDEGGDRSHRRRWPAAIIWNLYRSRSGEVDLLDTFRNGVRNIGQAQAVETARRHRSIRSPVLPENPEIVELTDYDRFPPLRMCVEVEPHEISLVLERYATSGTDTNAH
jgi:hypothetical protein